MTRKSQSQRHLVHHKSHICCPGLEPALCGENRVTNRLRHGTAHFCLAANRRPYLLTEQGTSGIIENICNIHTPMNAGSVVV